MSDLIKEYFYHAMAARACYVDLDPQMRDQEVISAITSGQSSMTDSMAIYFIDHFSVVDVSLNNSSGYDGVMFHEINTNHYVIANRGTEFGGSSDIGEILDDLGTDGLLALFGSSDQEGDMYRLIRDNIQVGAVLTATGHSLGGFLTTLATLMYPWAISTSYTYNGAGIDNVAFSGSILNAFAALAGINLTVSGTEPITNIRTAEGLDVTASTGFYYGTVEEVYTDLGAFDGVLGHGIINLSDALLVAYVLGCIDEDLSLAQVNAMVEGMASDANLDRNRTIAYLGGLFGHDVSAFRDNNAAEAELQAVAFDILKVVETAPVGVAAQDVVNVDATLLSIPDSDRIVLASTLRQDDANGVLARHAILNGSTFALQSAVVAVGQVPALDAVMSSPVYDADQFNDQVDAIYAGMNGETDLWLNLTEMSHRMATDYASDGLWALALEQLGNVFFWLGGNQYINDWGDGEVVHGNGLSIRYFGSADADLDPHPGGSGEDYLYGLGGDDTLSGGGDDDYLEGDAGSDTLLGGAGRDVLMGGTEADILVGGTGADELYGGEGDDTYRYHAGDGADTLRDADGLGKIEITLSNGSQLTLSGGKLIPSPTGQLYYDSAQQVYYRFTPYAGQSGIGTLTIFGDPLGGDDNQITIRDFHLAGSGTSDLGLDLVGHQVVAVLAGTHTSNPLLDPDYVIPVGASSLPEGRGAAYTIALNATASEARTLTLSASVAGVLYVNVPRNPVPQALGPGGVVLTIPAGASTVTVSIWQAGDIDEHRDVTKRSVCRRHDYGARLRTRKGRDRFMHRVGRPSSLSPSFEPKHVARSAMRGGR